jgi:hypothetical protein
MVIFQLFIFSGRGALWLPAVPQSMLPLFLLINMLRKMAPKINAQALAELMQPSFLKNSASIQAIPKKLKRLNKIS